MVPSSVDQMNVAALVVPGTRNVVVGFQTRPVGVAGAGFGGLLWSLCMQAVAGTLPPGSGSFTRSAWGTPAPSYSVEQPVALSEIQNGLAAGVNATPHAF